jgi:hypothetical protein
MFKKIALVLLVGVLLIPAVSVASYRFGFGGRIDPISGGIEFRLFFPNEKGNAFFLAPHAIGIFTYSEDDQNILYSGGLRVGMMFRQAEWLSPYVGIGGGSSGEIYQYNSYVNMGGRIFAGASIAPFQLLSRNSETFSGFRLDFDSGFLYKRRMDVIGNGTFEDTDDMFWFPDIGFSLNFNW